MIRIIDDLRKESFMNYYKEIKNLIEEKDPNLEYIFNNIDVLIDGPFIENLKDNELELRGSSNQRIIQLKIDKK